jgi:hypothetical protein
VASATALGIFFVPLFFVVIRRFFAPKVQTPFQPGSTAAQMPPSLREAPEAGTP